MEEAISGIHTTSLLSFTDAPAVESILTNRALDELKKQSSEGCLLCSFDAWDEEEWD